MSSIKDFYINKPPDKSSFQLDLLTEDKKWWCFQCPVALLEKIGAAIGAEIKDLHIEEKMV